MSFTPTAIAIFTCRSSPATPTRISHQSSVPPEGHIPHDVETVSEERLNGAADLRLV
jgi:hypothetical protein